MSNTIKIDDQNFLINFDAVSDRVEAMKDDIERNGTEAEKSLANAVAIYVYLSWLGLLADEIRRATVSDYNANMRVLQLEDKCFYVSEEKIADELKRNVSAAMKKNCKILRSDFSAADIFEETAAVAYRYRLSNEYILKMYYFNEQYDCDKNNRPKNKSKIKEIISNLGGEEIIRPEYELYRDYRENLIP